MDFLSVKIYSDAKILVEHVDFHPFIPRSDLNCTVSENLTGLVAPVKLWLRQEIERNTTHAEAVYQGVAMSLLAEYQRAPIFEMIKQHFEPTAGLEKLLEVMQASMERGEKLVQTVEDCRLKPNGCWC